MLDFNERVDARIREWEKQATRDIVLIAGIFGLFLLLLAGCCTLLYESDPKLVEVDVERSVPHTPSKPEEAVVPEPQ